MEFLSVGGATIDRRVEAEVGRALTPHGVRASLAAIAELTSAEGERKKIIQRQLDAAPPPPSRRKRRQS